MKNLWFYLLWAAITISIIPAASYAETCPAGTYETGRYETETDIFIKCRCDDERWWVEGVCTAPEKILKQEQTRAAIDLIVDGSGLSAMPEGDALRNWALAQNWEESRVLRLVFSTLHASRALFGRAEADLARALEGAEGRSIREDLLVRAYDSALRMKLKKASRQHVAGTLVSEAVNPEDIEELRRDTQRKIMRAAILRAQGNYGDAHALFNEVARAAQYTEDRAIYREAADAALWTQALMDQRMERLVPGIWDDLYQKHREYAAADQAWALGIVLADHTENYDAAVEALDEAYRYFKDHDPHLAGVIAKKREEAVQYGQKGRPVPKSFLKELEQEADMAFKPYDWTSFGMAGAPSKRAFIVMDALEYGKGDWERSIRFVKLHLKADPNNRDLRDALNYIEGLSAGR